MPTDPLSLRNLLVAQRQAFLAYEPEVEGDPVAGVGILAPPPAGLPALLPSRNHPVRLLSEATRASLEGHLTAEYVLPQSAGKNFRAALKAPFQAFWHWITRRSSKTSISEGASALSSGAKTTGRIPRLAAEVGEEIVHLSEEAPDQAIETNPVLHHLHLTDTVGEAIGAGEHIFGLARNLKELKDRGSEKKNLEDLRQTAAFLTDLLATPTEQEIRSRRDDFGPVLQSRLDGILNAHADSWGNRPVDDEGFADAGDATDVSPVLKRELALVEYQIHLSTSGLKSKDALWVSERSANSARYGFGIAHTGTSIATTAGSTAAGSIGAGLAHPIGVLNIAAGGFAVHRSVKAAQDAAKAASAQADAGAQIADQLAQAGEKSADLQSLLLEHKRRVEKHVYAEKSSEKKSQALQATDYFIRGALWIGGIVALSAAAPLFFGLTTAAMVLGGVGAGLSLCAAYSKFQRDAAFANKASGLQFLHSALGDAASVQVARENLIDTSANAADPVFRKSARHALKILDAINGSDKYEPLVGIRQALPEEDSRPGHRLSYSKDQLLEIATYKLAVRNSRALAAAFCDDVLNQGSRIDSRSLEFLDTQMGWPLEDRQLLLDLLAADRRQAEDFFCRRNKLPLPKIQA